jgi:hypothetical protein
MYTTCEYDCWGGVAILCVISCWACCSNASLLQENVRGCPIAVVLEHVQQLLPDYIWAGHTADGADFGGHTLRGRMYLLGIHSSIAIWSRADILDCIASCTRPRDSAARISARYRLSTLWLEFVFIVLKLCCGGVCHIVTDHIDAHIHCPTQFAH